MKITINPDTEFAKNKRKAIKDNGGYCIGCPKTPEWKCQKHIGCKAFQTMSHSGWCGEGLYYKDLEDNTNVSI